MFGFGFSLLGGFEFLYFVCIRFPVEWFHFRKELRNKRRLAKKNKIRNKVNPSPIIIEDLKNESPIHRSYNINNEETPDGKPSSNMLTNRKMINFS